MAPATSRNHAPPTPAPEPACGPCRRTRAVMADTAARFRFTPAELAARPAVHCRRGHELAWPAASPEA